MEYKKYLNSKKMKKYICTSRYKQVCILAHFRRMLDKTIKETAKEMDFLQSFLNSTELGKRYIKDEELAKYISFICNVLNADEKHFKELLTQEAESMAGTTTIVQKDIVIACSRIFLETYKNTWLYTC